MHNNNNNNRKDKQMCNYCGIRQPVKLESADQCCDMCAAEINQELAWFRSPDYPDRYRKPSYII